MWWTASITLSALLALLAGGDRGARSMALLCVAGIALMRLWGAAIPADFLWLSSALTWVLIGALSVHVSPATSGLLILSGLCYLWAKMGGYEFGASHPASVTADLLGVAALLSIGWRIRGRFVDHLGDWRLGRRAWGRN